MNKLSILAAMILLLALPACIPPQEVSLLSGQATISSSLPSPTSSAQPAPSQLPTKQQVPSPATSTMTKTARPTATLTATETATGTPTVRPSSIPTPLPTPWPTPANLQPAPHGWRWELHATGIPVTHYIIYELKAEDWEAPLERPYGLDDEPLPGIEPLPRPFLMQAAYQGSGRLPNGDVVQYAAVRPPVEQGLVPFRFVITPTQRCSGHPRAGNGACSVPLETAATTWREGENPLVPVGSTIFIPELNRKIRINDVTLSDGPAKIDLYAGKVNNYDYERPDGATIWILTEDSD